MELEKGKQRVSERARRNECGNASRERRNTEDSERLRGRKVKGKRKERVTEEGKAITLSRLLFRKPAYNSTNPSDARFPAGSLSAPFIRLLAFYFMQRLCMDFVYTCISSRTVCHENPKFRFLPLACEMVAGSSRSFPPGFRPATLSRG